MLKAPKATDEEIIEVLKIVGALQDINKLPEGINTSLGSTDDLLVSN